MARSRPTEPDVGRSASVGRSESARSRRRSGAVLALVTATIAVAGAEAGLRVVPLVQRLQPRTYVGDYTSADSPIFAADPQTGWRMTPGVEFEWYIDGDPDPYRMNDVGFRSPYAEQEVLDAPRKVVVVGDSFAFGTGVELHETFGAHLDAEFPEAIIYNVAMPGFAVDQMWLSVRNQALPLEPAAVVVAFVDHDLSRSLEAFRTGASMTKPVFVLEDGGLRPKRSDDRPAALSIWLQRQSAIWNLWRVAVRNAGYRWPVGEWWHLNRAVFERMHSEASENDVPVIFVRLPIRQARPFPQMRTFMESIGATYVDLNEREQPQTPLHFATDDHINEMGHLYVAQELAPLLREALAGS